MKQAGYGRRRRAKAGTKVKSRWREIRNQQMAKLGGIKLLNLLQVWCTRLFKLQRCTKLHKVSAVKVAPDDLVCSKNSV